MLEDLKKIVCEANQALPKFGLSVLTWGNVSGIDREMRLVVIKPSGVAYEDLTPETFPVVRVDDGAQIEGHLRPSSDTPTHLKLYQNFSSIGGVVHTHSRWATIFAQLKAPIPPLGTTHADYFFGDIPCTRSLSPEEIRNDYETATGEVIVETFSGRDANSAPAVLVASHGPFIWGGDAFEAVHHAVVLEEVAHMAWHARRMDPNLSPVRQELLDKHFKRKHGANAYYGQRKEET
jgi:L-ribulose-5-phosphate 4-epimerase